MAAASTTPKRFDSRRRREPCRYSISTVVSASSPAAIRPSQASAIEESASVASWNNRRAAAGSVSTTDIARSKYLRAIPLVPVAAIGYSTATRSAGSPTESVA